MYIYIIIFKRLCAIAGLHVSTTNSMQQIWCTIKKELNLMLYVSSLLNGLNIQIFRNVLSAKKGVGDSLFITDDTCSPMIYT